MSNQIRVNILIVGSGAREYSIGLSFLKDSRIKNLYFYPGNGGTENIGTNINPCNTQELINFIKNNQINLVVIGPEIPLIEGLADELKKAGIKVFGPSKKAARLEGSKAFMKDFVSRFNIPTAKYIQTKDLKKAQDFIRTLTPPIVVKADGVCAGKGVIIAQTQKEAVESVEDMLNGKSFGDAGKCVIIEEFLNGYELSVFAICDGEDYILLPMCQDHKRLLDNNEGPNTGGMGAYCPTPLCDLELENKIKEKIIIPTIKGMAKEGSPFVGILFAGIMVIKKNDTLEPYLLEFNVRFGDPECEVLLPLIETPLLDLCLHTIHKDLKNLNLKIAQNTCVGVVIASKDYPYKNSIPENIKIQNYDKSIGHICFAGVSKENETLKASGGRVLVCIGYGENFKIAKKNAYILTQKVEFDGMQYRKDIGFMGSI